jgi:DsbC/DsbD-like thiol-disulfide interchange protein
MPLFAESAPIPGVESLEFLTGWRNSDGTHTAALHIVLEDGFKTYWRAPGGNGIPAHFDFNGSKNVDGFEIHWPTPIAFDTQGSVSLGYKHELILPISFDSLLAKNPISLVAKIQMGVCSDICVPVETNIKVVLPKTGSQGAALIKAALKAQPISATKAGVSDVHCSLNPIEDGFEISTTMTLPNGHEDALMTSFELPHPDVWVTGAETQISDNSLTATAKIFVYGDDSFFLDRSALRLTVLGNETAIDIQGCHTKS